MGTDERSSFVARHKASLMVLASQISAAILHGFVKALENGTDSVGPSQVLLIRMLITGIGCSLYLWLKGVPEFPLGPRDVRPILLLRAFGGILGAGGMYYSIVYLTLSQATALNFLAPMGAMMLSKYTDHGNFSFTDRVGTAVALAGVVLVTQPDGIFRPHEAGSLGPKPDNFAKAKGLASGAVGVLGTTIALTTIRRIGSRAHALIVVNYFAWVIVLVATTLVVIELPSWPQTIKAWVLLSVVGVFGGLMEFLLTLGISGDRSSAATVMIYSQVLWALIIDRIVWHVQLNIWTFAGIGGVVGSLVLVSLAKEIPAYRRASGQGYAAVLTCDENGATVYDVDLDDIYAE
ncbi:hypothetical protein N0V93_009635 [Gnomoniopsis smithogilvyi]|uniref:EamA domain-containing protein n=1 Tax=Gnomoniopsis smithogilvyi TaxID=1191159 RepID=A0A9W8YNI4_9PEZI|nr:hypothetical protein N0V93_009635 [Gnomoniopsis smithogilvyi]